METFDRKAHWERIYQTRPLHEVGWYQPVPETSLLFLQQFQVPRTAHLIDIGGGDSLLVDHLLELGYNHITVLDISEAALDRAKKRLGSRAHRVKWIVADAADFRPDEYYDFWHDRAAFHFLTEDRDIDQYVDTARQHIAPTGVLVLGTFSENGPQKCSGIPIRQYSENTLTERFQAAFHKVNCISIDHVTPSNTVQNYVFCSFKKRHAS